MPYIDKDRRESLEHHVFKEYFLQNRVALNGPGELNFLVHKLIEVYLGSPKHPMCYDTLNSLIGVLGCIQQELYRRLVVPYEELKIAQNGDLQFLEDILNELS